METQLGGCSCGQVKFDITGLPLVRLCCHCTICQRFNDAAYADILIYGGASIESPAEGAVSYKSYKPKSPILRGKCSSCGDPVLEKTVSRPKLWIVPVSAYSSKTALTDPAAHIYYETRIADVNDPYPKHKGALKSNLVMLKHLVLAKLFR